MKGNHQKDIKTNETYTALNKAIDTNNVDEIKKQLEKLEEIEALTNRMGDSTLLAKRIIKENKKGNETMKNNSKKLGTMIASLSLAVLIGGGTIYATGLYKNFTYFGEETTSTVKSACPGITEEEMESMAKEASETYGITLDEGTTVVTPEEYTFASIEEVKEALDIEIAIPNAVPKDFVLDEEIYVESMKDEAFGKRESIYLTYSSELDENRRLGVSIFNEQLGEETTVVTTTDSVYKEEYTNAFGDEYKILEEDGGIIATTTVGNIEYAIIFLGVEEEEMHQIIDSTDLSIYR